MESKHCNITNTYTLYFNILFYLAITINNKRFLNSMGLHVIPFFLVSQYLMWYDKVAGTCKGWGEDSGWTFTIMLDIVAHWLLLFVYIYLYPKISKCKHSWIGYVSPLFLFLLYMVFIKFDARIYNNNHIGKYIVIYLCLLCVTTIILK